AARRAAEGGERLSAVDRLPCSDVRDVDVIGVVGIGADFGEVAGAAPETLVVIDLREALARIVGAEDAARFRVRTADDEDAPRIRRHDFDADAPEVFAFREAVGELAPRRAAVGRFEQTIALAVEVSVLPRSLARFPQDGVDRLRIGGVDRDVEGADVLILVKYFFE